MDKLSELSKPVMYVVRTLDGSVASVKVHSYTAPKGFTSDPLYSQEYVSALLAQRDAFEGAALALRDELREVREELEAKDKRIAELEAYNAKLRDWNAGLAQESCELQAKLATPVRLHKVTTTLGHGDYFDGVDNGSISQREKDAEAIRAAGFKVDGD